MTNNIRHLPAQDSLVEITCQTFQGRFLLRPEPALNRRFVGVLARALDLYDVKLHAVAVLSTHYHLLISPRNTREMARFMGHLNTNVSKEIGHLVGWKGALFDGPYSPVVVSDEPEAQIARLEYLLRQGCKEGLVSNPRDWPGVHSAQALADGTSLTGEWLDRTAYWQAKHRGEDVNPENFAQKVTVELAPLPCWAELLEEVWRQYVREMIECIERTTRIEHQAAGTTPAGVAAIARIDPHHKPETRECSPRPLVHAVCKKVRHELVEAYRRFLAAYRDAAERLKRGDPKVRFPGDCFPPGQPYVARA